MLEKLAPRLMSSSNISDVRFSQVSSRMNSVNNRILVCHRKVVKKKKELAKEENVKKRINGYESFGKSPFVLTGCRRSIMILYFIRRKQIRL